MSNDSDAMSDHSAAELKQVTGRKTFTAARARLVVPEQPPIERVIARGLPRLAAPSAGNMPELWMDGSSAGVALKRAISEYNAENRWQFDMGANIYKQNSEVRQKSWQRTKLGVGTGAHHNDQLTATNVAQIAESFYAAGAQLQNVRSALDTWEKQRGIGHGELLPLRSEVNEITEVFAKGDRDIQEDREYRQAKERLGAPRQRRDRIDTSQARPATQPQRRAGSPARQLQQKNEPSLAKQLQGKLKSAADMFRKKRGSRL